MSDSPRAGLFLGHLAGILSDTSPELQRMAEPACGLIRDCYSASLDPAQSLKLAKRSAGEAIALLERRAQAELPSHAELANDLTTGLRQALEMAAHPDWEHDSPVEIRKKVAVAMKYATPSSPGWATGF